MRFLEQLIERKKEFIRKLIFLVPVFSMYMSFLYDAHEFMLTTIDLTYFIILI